MFRFSFPLNYNLITLLFTVLILFNMEQSRAGEIDQVLQDTLAVMHPDSLVPVIIYLDAQVDLHTLEDAMKQQYGEPIPLTLRYQSVIIALQSIASQTQTPILQGINQFTQETYKDVIPLWVANIISIKTIPANVQLIASWNGVQILYYDSEMILDEPIEVDSTEETESNAAQPGLKIINAHKLWALGFTGSGRLVMNIDTGVEGMNVALQNRWRGLDPGVLPTWAWNDVANPNSIFPAPASMSKGWHGTHTMGTMCGLDSRETKNDTFGVAFGAKWIAARIFPHASTTKALCAFQWGMNPDSNLSTMSDVPDVINCSFTDGGISPTSDCNGASGYWSAVDAVEAAGIAVIWSAGNDGPNAQTISPPKNRNVTNVNFFTVGAIDGRHSDYRIENFSSRGPSRCINEDSLMYKPEVVAPGHSIRSTYKISGTLRMTATSAAAPHVAGAVALLKELNPELTGTELKYLLLNTAHELGAPGDDNSYGRGLIDLWAAYQNVPIPVSFTNEYNSTNVGGSLLVDYSDIIPSGAFRYLPMFSNHIVKTNNERFRINPNSTAKHHHWNDEISEYNVQHNFPVLANSNNDQIAHFRDLFSTTIRNELLDAPSVSGGNIGFRDPWYMYANGSQPDTFINFSSPFYPTGAQDSSSQGVFLHQGGDTLSLQHPYYSIKAFHPNNILGFTSYFLNWKSNGASIISPSSLETPVVFNNANDEVTALYKGHLLSSTPEATSSSSQRKLAKSIETENVYSVYESAGSVFETSQRENDPWEQEQVLELRTETSIARTPSIGYNNFRDFTAWERVNTSGLHEILVKRTTFTDTIDQFYENEEFYSLPSVSYGGTIGLNLSKNINAKQLAVVVWRSNESLKFYLRCDGRNTQILDGSVPGTDNDASNPSVIVENYQNTGNEDTYFYFHVTFESRGMIYYGYARYDIDNNSVDWSYISPVFEEYQEIQNPAKPIVVLHPPIVNGKAGNEYPSSLPHIFWQAHVTDNTCKTSFGCGDFIFYRTLVDVQLWEWSAIDEFTHSDGGDFHQEFSPTAAILTIGENNYLRSLWQCNDHLAYSEKLLPNGNWSNVHSLETALQDNAKSPHIVSRGESFYAVWTQGTEVPYHIRSYDFTIPKRQSKIFSTTDKDSLENQCYPRRGSVDFSKIKLHDRKNKMSGTFWMTVNPFIHNING